MPAQPIPTTRDIPSSQHYQYQYQQQYQPQPQYQPYLYDHPATSTSPSGFSLSNSLNGSGMSWSDYSIDFVARSPMDSSLHTPCGSPPALFAPGSFGDSGYKLEQDYCKNFSCCGMRLPDLHDLITHFEEFHVVLLGKDGRVILPSHFTSSSSSSSASSPAATFPNAGPSSPYSPIDSPVGPSTPTNSNDLCGSANFVGGVSGGVHPSHASGDAFLSASSSNSGLGLMFAYDHATNCIPINAQSLSPEDQYRLYTELRKKSDMMNAGAESAFIVSGAMGGRGSIQNERSGARLTAFGFPQVPASPPQSAFVPPPSDVSSSSTLRVQTSFTSTSSSATTPATTPLTTPVQPSLPMPRALTMSSSASSEMGMGGLNMGMGMGMPYLDEYCGVGNGMGIGMYGQDHGRDVEEDDVMMDFDPMGDMDGSHPGSASVSGHSSPTDFDLEFDFDEDGYSRSASSSSSRRASGYTQYGGLSLSSHSTLANHVASPTLSMAGLHRFVSSSSTAYSRTSSATTSRASTPTICLPPRMLTAKTVKKTKGSEKAPRTSKGGARQPKVKSSTSSSASVYSSSSSPDANGIAGGMGGSISIMGRGSVSVSTAAAVTAAMNAAARKRAREEKKEARAREREREKARVEGNEYGFGMGGAEFGVGGNGNGVGGMAMTELRVNDETEAAILASAKAARKERDKDFKCPLPACHKEYLNANGLKYHLNKGKCIFADDVSEEVIRINVEARRAGVAGSRLPEKDARD